MTTSTGRGGGPPTPWPPRSNTASSMSCCNSIGSSANCSRPIHRPSGVARNCAAPAADSRVHASSTSGTAARQPPDAPTPNARSHSIASAMGGGRHFTPPASMRAAPRPTSLGAVRSPGAGCAVYGDGPSSSGAGTSASRSARVATPVLNVVDSGKPMLGRLWVVEECSGNTRPAASKGGCGSTGRPAESRMADSAAFVTPPPYTHFDSPSANPLPDSAP